MKTTKLEDALDQVKRDLETPVPPHTLTKEKLKMATKKVKKVEAPAKAAKKSAKVESKSAPAKEKDNDGSVTLADLAAEAKISPAAARRKVRATEIERGDGRWAWAQGSKALKTVREALGLSK